MRALLIVALLVSRAAATPAEDAFERGRVLLTQKKIPEACAAFEESLRLDYQFGTLYNLALCDMQRGKLATALLALRKIAKEDHNAARRTKAESLATQLESRVPRIRIKVMPPDATLTLDGQAVVAAERVPVDIGPHEVTAEAPNTVAKRRSVEATREGETVVVAIELAAEQQQAPPPPPPPTSRRALAGKIVIGVGAAALISGLVVGGVALRDWNHAQETAKTDPDAANAEVEHVQRLGNASTVLVVAGAVAASVGIYLWRSGKSTVQASIAPTGDGLSVVLSGRL